MSCEDHFRILLSNGADKISMNTYAFEKPEFITTASEKYGAQCVVVSIDYKLNDKGEYRVYINNGQKETSKHPIDWALECERLGAGEILLTSIDKDGMNQGLDLDVTEQVSESLHIPVIASGGCGFAKHFVDGYLIGKADAVAAGSFFCS